LISTTLASFLSPTDLKLIQSIADKPLITVSKYGQPCIPRTCKDACSYLRHNTTTGGECFALFLTTPTCLYIPFLAR
jgi:hypothetical protein